MAATSPLCGYRASRPISGLSIGSQAMAAHAAAPWPGADGIRERHSRFNNSHSPAQPRYQCRGFFFAGAVMAKEAAILSTSMFVATSSPERWLEKEGASSGLNRTLGTRPRPSSQFAEERCGPARLQTFGVSAHPADSHDAARNPNPDSFVPIDPLAPRRAAAS
jgi:hypothetical protein